MGRRKRDLERILHDDERIQARESEEYLLIEYKQPHTLRIPKSDRSWQDLEMVRMNRLRTLAGRKYWVAAATRRPSRSPGFAESRLSDRAIVWDDGTTHRDDSDPALRGVGAPRVGHAKSPRGV